jgi:hypothetical protein
VSRCPTVCSGSPEAKRSRAAYHQRAYRQRQQLRAVADVVFRHDTAMEIVQRLAGWEQRRDLFLAVVRPEDRRLRGLA